MNRNSFITQVEKSYLTGKQKQKLPHIMKKLDEQNIPSQYIREQNIIDEKFHNNKRLHINDMKPHFEKMKELTKKIHDIVLDIIHSSSVQQKQEDTSTRLLQKIS